MEDSILTSIKKVLGLTSDYTPFDEDVIMHINTVFSTLTQLGIGPTDGFMIEDEDGVWSEYTTEGVQDNELNSVKTYVFLRVKMLFDPPASSYHTQAMQDQIAQLEWRLNVSREAALNPIEE